MTSSVFFHLFMFIIFMFQCGTTYNFPELPQVPENKVFKNVLPGSLRVCSNICGANDQTKRFRLVSSSSSDLSFNSSFWMSSRCVETSQQNRPAQTSTTGPKLITCWKADTWTERSTLKLLMGSAENVPQLLQHKKERKLEDKKE